MRYDYTPFYEGRVAFWPLYLNAQAVIIGDKLAQAGETFDVISPDRLGVKFVANSVVTTREMLEKHPDTVKRFLAALRQGWQDALNPQNEEQAVQVLLQMDRETPAAVVRRQLAVTRELMLPAPGAAFGTIDIDAWKQTAQIMAAQQLIPAQLNVESVLMTDLDKIETTQVERAQGSRVQEREAETIQHRNYSAGNDERGKGHSEIREKREKVKTSYCVVC